MEKNKKKDKRIVLTVSHISASGSKVITDPEESWYHLKNRVEASFVIQASDGRYITLHRFFLPREWTELVADESHPSGYQLKIRDWLRDWSQVCSEDYSKYICCWPLSNEEMRSFYPNCSDDNLNRHKTILLSGWARLICVWFNEDLREEVLQDLLFWENFLVEEMSGFRWLYRQLHTEGIRSVLDFPKYGKKDLLQWLKIASCCVELISDVCPNVIAVCAIDRGQTYPAIWAGHQWMKHHRLKSWDKVPKN